MGLRFRKSIKLAPGVRVNFSALGAGLSFGPRGASVSVGRRGVYANVGLPGTGLSARQRLDRPATSRSAAARALSPPPAAPVSVTVTVTDEGEVVFKDGIGSPLDESMVRAARKQHGDAIRVLVESACATLNGAVDAMAQLHWETPSPARPQPPEPYAFEPAEPIPPALVRRSVWARLIPSLRRKADAEDESRRFDHEAAHADWARQSDLHLRAEATRQATYEQALQGQFDAMEAHLEEVLRAVAWPRETLVSTEVLPGGRSTMIDVDLPEIEDMPSRVASVPSRGLKLSIKPMSATRLQQLYMQHVHAIGFRLIGEAFAALPTLQCIVLSGYSQRRDRTTGHVADEYLYSVCVDREAWSRIDFSAEDLAALDVVEALAHFHMVRTMSKTGVFRPVVPITRETLEGASP